VTLDFVPQTVLAMHQTVVTEHLGAFKLSSHLFDVIAANHRLEMEDLS
jgi:hypothetical protein